MMQKTARLFSFIIAILAFTACGNQGSNGQYGATFEIPETALTANDLAEAAKDNTGETVVVKGTVERVCKASKCWCSITDTEGNRYYLNVKDEAFKLPVDCEGKTVYAKGRIVSVAEQKENALAEGLTPSYVESITNPSLETVGYIFE